jgi:hypothetical protein
MNTGEEDSPGSSRIAMYEPTDSLEAPERIDERKKSLSYVPNRSTMDSAGYVTISANVG